MPASPLRVLSARAFFRRPLDYVRRHADGQASLRLAAGPRRFVLVRDPGAVWDVLVSDAATYRQGKWKRRARRFIGDTLNTLSGEEHRRRRLLLQPALDRRRVATFTASLAQRAERTVASWDEGPLDVRGALDPLSLSLAAEVLLGDRLERRAESLAASLAEVMTLLPRLTPPLPGTAGARELAVVDAELERLVAARRASGPGSGDLLDALLGGGLPEPVVRGELHAFLLAAVDEPPSGLAAALFLLGQHAETQAALQDEVDREPAGGPLLDAVLREALRLYPPARYIDRCPLRDTTIAGEPVRAGTNVLVSPLVLHHEPGLYERAESFEPERWLAAGDGERPRGAYIPFGAGAHSCIGEPVARLIMTVTLAAIARTWHVQVPDGAPQPVPRAPRLVLTLERR